MSSQVPSIYLVRHGGTAWSVTGQHTGRTDIALSAEGEREAAGLRRRLANLSFSQVATSPLQRALRTCEIAGFGADAIVDNDLVEWDYGDYEGITTSAIRVKSSDWDLFRDGCPGGESPAQIAARADRVINRLRGLNGSSLVFSHGHFLRVLTARWLSLEVTAGRGFALATTSLSILSSEHGGSDPVVWLWNDCHHVTQ